jgi:putative transposase
MNRGHNRETVFADDDDRRHFLNLLARDQERFPWRLYHYCLMSNHFHLLVQLQEPKNLSLLVAGLLRSYVHYFNRRYGFCGHLWQGRFKSPAIEVERYLLSCGRYIERNPVEAGMVEAAWQYPWSSCRHYALGEPDALLADNPWYDAYATTPEQRQERWRLFLQGGDPAEPIVRRDDWLVGKSELRHASVELRSRPMPRGRGRPINTGSIGRISM